jgi:hypothetical protein
MGVGVLLMSFFYYWSVNGSGSVGFSAVSIAATVPPLTASSVAVGPVGPDTVPCNVTGSVTTCAT